MADTAQARLLLSCEVRNNSHRSRIYPYQPDDGWRRTMGRYLLLWLLGIPLPILVLIYAFGGLNH